MDILKTLKLVDKEGFYNIAGELLADKNNTDYSGVDIVRFGRDSNQILDRETFNNMSLLTLYDKTIEVFQRYYQYEEIDGYSRVRKELIPREAFREALANAIVHRAMDIRRYIQIAMYKDRIEINSPGGLPKGISKENYLDGNVSILRNPIVAGVFYRLKYIEQFGTGIGRIINEYAESLSKPSFKIDEDNIKIVLPLLETDFASLSHEEVEIYRLIKEEDELSRLEIEGKTGFNKTKALRVIKNLTDKNLLEMRGKGPRTTYVIK